MPLRLSISFSRKIGEANYGSRGAIVSVELEAESRLVQRPEEFKQQAAELFRLARESVDRELALATTFNHTGISANGSENGRTREVRAATASQVRAIHAIANEHELDLSGELQRRFGVLQAGTLSFTQASTLITELQSTDREEARELEAASPSAAENSGSSF